MNFWSGFGFGFLNGSFGGMFPFGGGFFGNPFGWGLGCGCPCHWNFTPMFFTENLMNTPLYQYPNMAMMTPLPSLTPPSFHDNYSYTAMTDTFTSSSKEEEKKAENNTKTKSSKDTTLAEKKTEKKTEDKNTNDNTKFSYTAKELKTKWCKKKPNLSDEFYEKVVNVAKRLNCSPNDLMGLMNSESNIKANAVNKPSGATGLIQFMPATAESLGTSVQELKSMSAVKQLDYVEKYLLNCKHSAGICDSEKIDRGTLYAFTFLPAYAKKDILAQSGDKYYKANKGLDVNKDGKISKADLTKRIEQFC